MNYTNGSARGHVSRLVSGDSADTVLSLEKTKHGLRLCVRKPATLLSRRPARAPHRTDAIR